MKIFIFCCIILGLGGAEKYMPTYNPSSSTELCRVLLWTTERGICMIADLNKRNPGVWGNSSVCAESESTPLHEAVKKGNNPVVRLLLALGADLNAQDSFGRTPLHYAVNTSAHSSIVFDLIHAAAKVNIPDDHGDTPLHVAVRTDLKSLHWARYGGDLKVKSLNSNFLLVAGAYRSMENEVGETPVSIAMNGDEELAMFMLEEKILHIRFPYEICEDVWRQADSCEFDKLENGIDIFGRTKLFRSIITSINDSISDDDFAGSDVNAKDVFNRTALHEASRLGKIEIVKKLLANKAKVNLRDWLGQTPLHLASLCLREDVKEELQKSNANMKGPDRKGRTPEDIANFVS